ncbi:MAG: hypothetical protein RL758_581 [Pseudomonadota bacterium]|jgi:glyoxylase-like metal-dependent hydrolase (beta-lactamase superfamily II)
MGSAMPPLIDAHFEASTSTFSYIVTDPATRACAIVDSVLGYDPKSGRTNTQFADQLIARVRALNAEVQWHLETHVHADHLSAAAYLQSQLGGRTAIGQHITAVQKVFGEIFHAEPEFRCDGSLFDQLWADGDVFSIGQLRMRAMHTPGHTPACMTYVLESGDTWSAFVGDTLFMPDYGTARCDFPGGDAHTLYRSIQKVLGLPANTRLFMCHDYPPGGRTVQFETTVAQQRLHNIHVREGIAEADFVQMRTARDATLDMPVLLLPSVQINMRAGQWPPPESNGTRYIKIPLNIL